MKKIFWEIPHRGKIQPLSVCSERERERTPAEFLHLSPFSRKKKTLNLISVSKGKRGGAPPTANKFLLFLPSPPRHKKGRPHKLDILLKKKLPVFFLKNN